MTSRGPLDPRLLRHARAGRAGIAAIALLGVGQAAATVVVAVALTAVVTGGPRPGPLGLLAGAFTARAALSWAEQVTAQRTAARVTDELRRAVLAATLRRGPAWAASFGTGRLTAVLTGGLDALRPWFGGYLPALILGAVLPPTVLTILAVTDPASALTVLLTLPLIPLFGVLVGWATQRRANRRWAAGAHLASHFLDVVRGLGTLQLYGRAARQVTVVTAMTDRHRAATLRVLRVAFLSSTALDLVGTLSVGLVAVGAGVRVAGGDLSLGPALLAILLAPEAYRPLRDMAARFHASTDATAVIADVDEILCAPSLAPAGEAPPAPGPAIAARGLRVRHPGAAADALSLDALTVRPGELVALRGASGAGKTTTLRVLAGLQPHHGGETRVTGTVHYLPQRPTLPHVRTVAEAVGGELSDEEVGRALRTVGLDAELAGPRAPLGEHGHGVSSGQRQRLALAGLLRAADECPAVLLLDEPTAHLDAGSERVVIALLRAAADRGCAVLVVAHRPALLAAADRIVTVTRPPAGPARSPAVPAHQLPAPARSPAVPAHHLPAARVPPGSTATIRRAGTPDRRRAGAAVLLGAASWLAGLTLTAAAGWLLVRAATLPPILTLSTAVVLVRGSAVARPLLRYLERLVAHDVAFARLGDWRAGVYAGLVARGPVTGRTRRGELLTRVVDDVDARVDGLLRGRLPAAAAALTLGIAATALGLAVPGSAATAWIVAAAGSLVAALAAPALAARHAAHLDVATGRARAELGDAIVETVHGVEELAVRGEAGALDVPGRRSRALSGLEARAARSAGTATGLAHLGWGLTVVATAVAVGGVPTELAALVLLGVVSLAEPVLALPDAAVARRRAAGARARLATIAPATGTTGAATASAGATRAATTSSGPVLRGVVAGWDPDQPPVLRGLDLDLAPGARIAVRGASGSGKSTLAAVVTGLLEPRHGEVTWGRRTALVGDGFDHVFASTVRENLRLARPEATDDDLRGALRRVRLDGWLTGLPHGLDTWLGEGGATMSGGERKRLATARALLTTPDLLVLDEPTEGLDEPTAAALVADLLGGGQAVLLLTHRQEGLDLADAVFDLVDGRLQAVVPPTEGSMPVHR